MSQIELVLFVVRFRDGAEVVVKGTCAADAGTRALPIRDRQRGDRLAVVEKIVEFE